MGIIDKFQLWNSKSSVARDTLVQNLPWRSFNELSTEEKKAVLQHFSRANYFWGYRSSRKTDWAGDTCTSVDEVEYGVTFAVNTMINLYKKECYAPRTLENWTVENVYLDFRVIFMERDQHIVYELISIYGYFLIKEGQKSTPCRIDDESEAEYRIRVKCVQYKKFDAFRKVFNEIFEDYRINIYLTCSGLVPRQDKKILEEVYDPVLENLSDIRWSKVNRELKDAFTAISKATPDGYSESMTHCYSAVQAFLQELVGDTNLSIKNACSKAREKGLIPSDPFSNSGFAELLSTFEQLRKKHGDAHPKEDYANAKSAQLMLNLTMVYLQHGLQ